MLIIMDTALHRANTLKHRIISLNTVFYINQMCSALSIDCVCKSSNDFIEMKDVTDKINYAVVQGFLPLFEFSDEGTLKPKSNITINDIQRLETYYSTAFLIRKRVRNKQTLSFINNNIQCVLLKIVELLRQRT